MLINTSLSELLHIDWILFANNGMSVNRSEKLKKILPNRIPKTEMIRKPAPSQGLEGYFLRIVLAMLCKKTAKAMMPNKYNQSKIVC